MSEPVKDYTKFFERDKFYGMVEVLLKNIMLSGPPDLQNLRRLLIFVTVSKRSTMSLAELKEMFDISPAILWQDLDCLLQLGYAEKDTEGRDARFKTVTITDRGYDALDEFMNDTV